MVTSLSLSISILAFVLSTIKIPRLSGLRRFFVLLACGAGQIHLAFFTLLLFLYIENGFRFPIKIPARSFVILFTLYVGVLVVTLANDVDGRNFSELFQLLLYIFIFFQLHAVLKRPGETELYIRSSAYAALAVACLGLTLKSVELTHVPHIFIARGANEGSTFLTFMGVIPTVYLFLKTKNPVYLLFASVMLYAQMVAMSRANTVFSVIALMSILFFVWKQVRVRVLLTAGIVACILLYFDSFRELSSSYQNYSFFQRVLLYEAGYEYWVERPWLGWGWGASSKILPENNLIDSPHPHFHSTFVQFTVELGALGVFVILLWIMILVWFIIKGFYGGLSNERRAYIALSATILFLAGAVESMLFGADRSIQVVFLFAISLSMVSRTNNQPAVCPLRG